jgi:hypothetical protein
MDTRFWGPSGWKFLHVLSFTYDPSSAPDTAEFLATLPYILPCKFCRYSLTEYYAQLPYGDALISQKSLATWMYKIHNYVNDKLRKQGLNPSPDPKFTDVATMYRKWLAKGVTPCVSRTFWDFLFAVAHNHPKEASRNSTPMPECPKHCNKLAEKNKWNLMTADERMPFYRRFWELIPVVMPVLKWQEAPVLDCRRSVVAWLWRQRCKLEPDFKDPYREVCSHISSYASGCSASTRARTCRKTRKRTVKG